MKNKSVLEALKKAKVAVDEANQALDTALEELSPEEASEIVGGSAWDHVPPVIEHPYDPSNP